MPRTKGIKLYVNVNPHVTKNGSKIFTGERDQFGATLSLFIRLFPCDFWLFDYVKRNLTDQTDEDSL